MVSMWSEEFAMVEIIDRNLRLQADITRAAKLVADAYGQPDWIDYRDALRVLYGEAITDDYVPITAQQRAHAELSRGQLRIGGPGDWFATLRWRDQAWFALHGEKGWRAR